MAKVYLTPIDLQENELLNAVLHNVPGPQPTGVPGGKFQYRSDTGDIEWYDAVAGAWKKPGTGEVATHEGAADPHSQYLTQAEGDALYEADGAVAAHEAAGDPHPQYQTQAESDARYVNETDFTKAAIDALNVDADTLDGLDSLHFLARGNHTGTQAISTVSGLQTALDGKEVKSSRGVANGYASLDGFGKVPSGQLPALAITETYVVASTAERDALTVEEGDVAVVTNVGSWIWDGTAWIELIAPDDIIAGNGLTRSGDQLSVVAGSGIIVDGSGVHVDGEWISDAVGAMVAGNTETGLTVTYQDADNTLDFAVAYGTVVALDGALSSGSGNTAARANHKHSITKAAIDALNVDADTLDGLDSTDFAPTAHNHSLFPNDLTLEKASPKFSLSDTGSSKTFSMMYSGTELTLGHGAGGLLSEVLLRNLADPISGTDAATKYYVDDNTATIDHVHNEAHAVTIGDGAATSIAVAHNLGTTDVVVQIQDLSQTPDAVAEADYQITDANTVTFVFSNAPAANSIRVVILSATAYTGTLVPKTAFSVAKTADEVVNNSAVIQDDDHLFLSLEATSRYQITMGVDIDASAMSSALTTTAFSIPSGATLVWGGPSDNVTTGTSAKNLSTAGARRMFLFVGHIETSSAGTLRFRWAQLAAEANDLIVKAGSWLRVEKIG